MHCALYALSVGPRRRSSTGTADDSLSTHSPPLTMMSHQEGNREKPPPASTGCKGWTQRQLSAVLLLAALLLKTGGIRLSLACHHHHHHHQLLDLAGLPCHLRQAPDCLQHRQHRASRLTRPEKRSRRIWCLVKLYSEQRNAETDDMDNIEQTYANRQMCKVFRFV